MRVTEAEAKKKWCPFVRVEGSNRIHNLNTDGFDAEHRFQHCIGSVCMAWRTFGLTMAKGGGDMEHHGYCGLAGRPDVGD